MREGDGNTELPLIGSTIGSKARSALKTVVEEKDSFRTIGIESRCRPSCNRLNREELFCCHRNTRLSRKRVLPMGQERACSVYFCVNDKILDDTRDVTKVWRACRVDPSRVFSKSVRHDA